MRPISVHVAESDYQRFKMLAARKCRPVAELIREAMAVYLGQLQRKQTCSFLDIPAHDSGDLLRGWSRSELMDEIIEP